MNSLSNSITSWMTSKLCSREDFLCWLQTFRLFQLKPCDFSRFSSRGKPRSRSEKSQTWERIENSEKVFLPFSQFASIFSSCRKSSVLEWDEFSSEMKRKSGKDLWRRRRKVFNLSLFSNYFQLNFSTDWRGRTLNSFMKLLASCIRDKFKWWLCGWYQL